MHQNDQTDAPLLAWLAEHAAVIDKLRQSDHDLDDMLDDHSRLTEAVDYWSGQSAERAEEFRDMARELEQEIAEYVMHRPALESSRLSAGSKRCANYDT